MIYQGSVDIIGAILEWLKVNLQNIIIVASVIIIGWIFFLIFKKEISRLRKLEKLEEQTARNLQKLVKVLVVLIIISTILVLFVQALGLITSLFSLVGGTILGFAAINTIGNSIAGIIIMVSRPFVSGDYIMYKNRLARVHEVKLIYTTLIDLDGIRISIPNQRLISDGTENLGKNDPIRRSISITVDYKEDQLKVENALLEAVNTINEITKEPKPYVRITNFLNFAIEYTLFVYISKIKLIPMIEAKLRQSILNSVNKYSIDISTPNLVKNI
jgi:small conductance mechanosensitive channel